MSNFVIEDVDEEPSTLSTPQAFATPVVAKFAQETPSLGGSEGKREQSQVALLSGDTKFEQEIPQGSLPTPPPPFLGDNSANVDAINIKPPAAVNGGVVPLDRRGLKPTGELNGPKDTAQAVALLKRTQQRRAHTIPRS